MAEEKGVDVISKSPKERANAWADKGLAWAASEYCNLAGIQGDERNKIMSNAHENAAARYQVTDKAGSSIEGNPLNQ